MIWYFLVCSCFVSDKIVFWFLKEKVRWVNFGLFFFIGIFCMLILFINFNVVLFLNEMK